MWRDGGATMPTPEYEWAVMGASRVYETVKALGFPGTLYISPADFERIRNSFKTECDLDGAFFWIGPTKVRLRASPAMIDKSNERLWV